MNFLLSKMQSPPVRRSKLLLYSTVTKNKLKFEAQDANNCMSFSRSKLSCKKIMFFTSAYYVTYMMLAL